MNTRNDFLDNAVYDEVGIDGTGDLNTEMCSTMQNDIEEMCSSMSNHKYRVRMSTTSAGFVKLLDLREGNEENFLAFQKVTGKRIKKRFLMV